MKELIAQTKQHLLEEYAMSDWVWTDPETHAFFKKQSAPKVQTPQPAARAQPPPPRKAPPLAPRKRAAPPKPAEEKPQKPVSQDPPQRSETKAEKIRKDFRELRLILQEKAPKLKVVDEIPDDALAKQIANAWKDSVPEVAVITINPTKAHLELLEKIAGAINGVGFRAKVLIGEQQWERLFNTPHLRLVLVPQETLDSHPEFKKMESVEVCPLLPIETYIETPKEKAALWKEIRRLLQV